jgi:hypothetical protein
MEIQETTIYETEHWEIQHDPDGCVIITPKKSVLVKTGEEIILSHDQAKELAAIMRRMGL